MASPELLGFTNEIQNELPKSEVKGLDPLTIITLVMKILEIVINFWKEHKAANDNRTPQEFIKSMGFIKMLMLKQKAKRQMSRAEWRDGMFAKTLDKTTKLSYDSLSKIAEKDLKISL